MIKVNVISTYYSGPGVLDENKSTLTIRTDYYNFPLDSVFSVNEVNYKFISSSKSLYIDGIIIIKVEKLL